MAAVCGTTGLTGAQQASAAAAALGTFRMRTGRVEGKAPPASAERTSRMCRAQHGPSASSPSPSSTTSSASPLPQPLPARGAAARRGGLAVARAADVSVGVRADSSVGGVDPDDLATLRKRITMDDLLPVDPEGDMPEELAKDLKQWQQNLLELNSRRLEATETMLRAKRDNELLASRIKELEAERQVYVRQAKESQAMMSRFQLQQSVREQLMEANAEGALLPGELPPMVWASLHARIDAMFLAGKLDWHVAEDLRQRSRARDAALGARYLEVMGFDDASVIQQLSAVARPRGTKNLHVVHICSELAPVIGDSSMATFVAGLSRALLSKGHHVEVLLPWFDGIEASGVEDLRCMENELKSYYQGEWWPNKVWTGVVGGIPVYFIDPQHPANMFGRGQLYGFQDDFERFAYFSRAALELLCKLGRSADIIHCHGWQAALVPVLYWEMYAPNGWDHARMVFTVHDFKAQMLGEPYKLELVGLRPDWLCSGDRLQDNSDFSRVNLVKGGIVFSNKVTTVSPMKELAALTAEGGAGLQNTLHIHRGKFAGVQNGIDEREWNPASDFCLPSTYSAVDINGKLICKQAVVEALGLANDASPLVVCIASDLTEEQYTLVKDAVTRVTSLGGQFVLLGASRVSRVKSLLETLESQLRSTASARIITRFDERQIRRTLAGGDIALVLPSEEVGPVNELVALKYGAVPVALQLRDMCTSVFDVDEQRYSLNDTNGYAFYDLSTTSVSGALARAVNRYQSKRDTWPALVMRGMLMDFSWEANASCDYIDCYNAVRKQ